MRERGSAHLILLFILLLLAVLGFLIFKGIIALPSPKEESAVTLQTEYDNPFEEESQYENPFDAAQTYENPFESLE